MPDFTIETTYHLPVYRHRSYSADTVAQACRLAVEDENWDGEKSDSGSAGESHVTGIWPGSVTPYSVPSIAVPSHFGEAIQRKAGHFETLLGLLKMLLADICAGDTPPPEWIARATWAVARGEAILAGARDPDLPSEIAEAAVNAAGSAADA